MDSNRAEPSLSTADIRAEVLGYLAEVTAMPQLMNISEDVVLSELGLDSFGTLEFVLGLESRLQVSIQDRHMNARLLRSVNGIVDVLVSVYAEDNEG